jgi:hypothetical protein
LLLGIFSVQLLEEDCVLIVAEMTTLNNFTNIVGNFVAIVCNFTNNGRKINSKNDKFVVRPSNFDAGQNK